MTTSKNANDNNKKNIFNSITSKLLMLYKNLPILIKLSICLNIAILIPFATLSLVSFKNTEYCLKNKSSQYSQDILKIINLRFEDYIGALKTVSTDLVTDSTILQYISSYDDLDTDAKQDANEKVKSKLKNKLRTREEMQAVAIFYDENNWTADKSNSAESIANMIPTDKDDYYQMKSICYQNKGEPTFYISKANTKEDKVFYVRAILSEDNYEPCGMLTILVDPTWFSSLFNGLVNYDMRSAAIITPDNKIILSHISSDKYSPTTEALQQLDQQEGFYNDEEKNTIISYVTNQETNWKIATFIPLTVLYSDVDYVKNRILVSLIFAVLFLFIVSFYISYDIVDTINKLVVGMQNLQDGYENVEVKLNRKDELGFMGDTFNTMVKEITTLQEWVIKEKLTRKDAQIKALQSQINPHFLFNTLESINWMAQLNNVPEISVTVTALASLMEASIAREGKLITLEQEINYIDNYIIILKQRFQDKLELHKNIDESLFHVKVPRLIIQPIVENAANHGIANSRGKGIVDLIVKRNGAFVIIIVKDNGIGVSGDELEKLRKRLSKSDDDDMVEDDQNKKHHGIGLENVNKRIKLFYGPEYGIQIDSELGQYTKVTLQIPMEANDRTQIKQEKIIEAKENA